MRLNKVAIILPFNDIGEIHGGSRSGFKGQISYFDMFLMLVESIKENWQGKYFEYRIIALHSLPFSDEKKAILEQINVDVVKANYDEHPLKIRPAAYTMDFDCDFRLILDVDMIALKEPNFDFSKDVLSTYGGNKYNKGQWKDICAYLGCKTPNFVCLKLKIGHYRRWRFLEHYLYQAGWIKGRVFPYFNNGAVLIKNECAAKVGSVWLDFRRLYTQYIQETQGADISLEGQDVIGLAINQITDNWSILPRGCNYIVQENFYLGRRLIARTELERLSLFHYISVSKGNLFFTIVDSYYSKVRSEYYKN
jgi:hypothetical protein